jgi:hypothetical protein
MDLTYIEAYLRNLLVRLGQEYGLPLAGRDWELGVAAVLILIALLLWTWPTRRAFRVGGPLRWLVAALNLGSLAFWPVWVFALLLSGIRPSTTVNVQAKPVQPRSAPAPTNPVPALLADALKALVRTAQQRASGGTGKPTLGPWGKQPRPAAVPAGKPDPAPIRPARPAPTPTVARAGSAPRMPAKPVAITGTGRRGSPLPNRETWIRRRG